MESGNNPSEYTTRWFTLQFSFAQLGQTIPVTLIATKNGQSDTVKKHFTVMAVKGTPIDQVSPFVIDLNYLGKFKGAFEDEPNHSFVVNIVNFGAAPAITNGRYFWDFRVLNMPEGCGGFYAVNQPCVVKEFSPAYYSYSFQYTFKSFYVNEGDSLGCCPSAVLYGHIDSVNRDKIIIEYNRLNSMRTDTLMKRKFIGYKQ